MAKKNDDTDDGIVEGLLNDIANDRNRLSKYFDTLLQQAGSDIICADQVAKVAEALTRQNHLRIDVIKAKIKSHAAGADDRDTETFDDIGKPFAPIEEEGQN